MAGSITEKSIINDYAEQKPIQQSRSKKKNEQWYPGEPILPALGARESQIKGGAQPSDTPRPD